MHSLPKNFFNWSTQILYAAVCPAFFFIFVLVYEPFHFRELLDMGRDLYSMNLPIVTCIVFGVLACTRVGFHFFRKSSHFTWAYYISWCIGEVLVVGMFVSLYVYLMMLHALPYFTVLMRCVGDSYLILIFPYLILTLSFCISSHHIREKELRMKEAEPDDSSLIRFYDVYKTLKLIIAQSAILYIESDENYVNIVYSEGGRTKRYTLRTTMRSLEETAEKHGLVRCQRSYYVNPSHVTVLRKETGGQVVAQLDIEGLPSIPVSKGNYEKLAKLL